MVTSPAIVSCLAKSQLITNAWKYPPRFRQLLVVGVKIGNFKCLDRRKIGSGPSRASADYVSQHYTSQPIAQPSPAQPSQQKCFESKDIPVCVLIRQIGLQLVFIVDQIIISGNATCVEHVNLNRSILTSVHGACCCRHHAGTHPLCHLMSTIQFCKYRI